MVYQNAYSGAIEYIVEYSYDGDYVLYFPSGLTEYQWTMYESDFDLKYSYCPKNDYNDYNYTVAKTFNLLKNKSAKKVSPLKALPKKANEKPEALVGDVEKKDSSAGKFQSLFKNMKKSPFQSLFKNMKKTEKSSDFASIISSVAHKSLINTQLENEVD